SIDADYLCSPQLMTEISTLEEEADVTGYKVGFRYCVFNSALRSTLYPDRVVLYRRRRAIYQDEGHGHRVRVEGTVRPLAGKIDHDDRKPLGRWIRDQDRYSIIEAKHLVSADSALLPLQDRVRLGIYFAPIVMLIYLLIGQRLILDGWRGWYYVMQRVIAECLLSVRLLIQKHDLEPVRNKKSEVASK